MSQASRCRWEGCGGGGETASWGERLRARLGEDPAPHSTRITEGRSGFKAQTACWSRVEGGRDGPEGPGAGGDSPGEKPGCLSRSHAEQMGVGVPGKQVRVAPQDRSRVHGHEACRRCPPSPRRAQIRRAEFRHTVVVPPPIFQDGRPHLPSPQDYSAHPHPPDRAPSIISRPASVPG